MPLDPGGEQVVIGQVTRAHGVRGAVRVRATGPTLATLRRGETVRWTGRDGGSRDLQVASIQDSPPDVILGFAGVDTRDDAEPLAGGRLHVPESRLPRDPDPDVVFVRDLVGCTVALGDREVGTVGEVLTRPANDVLEVARPDGPALLIPFTRDAVVELDLAARRIVVRPDLIDPDAPEEPPPPRDRGTG